MGQSKMDSPEKLVTLITQDTWKKTKITKAKTTTQKAKKKKMSNTDIH